MNGVINLENYHDLSLDGVRLPGAVQSVSVNGEILIDSSTSAGDGRALKVMRGFGDKTVNISLTLVNIENFSALDQLGILEKLFKRLNASVPKIFVIAHEHVQARNIGQVVFKSLGSRSGADRDTIEVSLNFEEFRSASYAQEG